VVTETYPTQAPAAPATRSDGLWSWISTVDHKRIGIMYLILTFFFFLVGGVFALVLRLQLSGPSKTLVSPEIYDQIMTMPPNRSSQKERAFSRGKAMSRAPICSGTR